MSDHVRLLRLNVEAMVDLCGRFVPPMVERRRGAVLNVCSLSSFIPWPAMATYAASKAAALSFTEALHTELRPLGVAVTAVCPGFVRTEFIEVAGPAEVAAGAPRWIFESPADVAEHGVRALERNRRSPFTHCATAAAPRSSGRCRTASCCSPSTGGRRSAEVGSSPEPRRPRRLTNGR